MSSKLKTGIGALIAGSLLWSSAAVAAPATGAPAPQVNPWAVLSAMSGGAPAAAICGAAAVAAAAQSPNGCVLPVMDAAPIAPVPIEPQAPPAFVPLADALSGEGLLVAALAAIVGAYGIYTALHHRGLQRANSPA